VRRLQEAEALAAVVASVRQLFPLVTEKQSRELARRVIRNLADRGVVLAVIGEAEARDNG
jgi:hypothetical protein